MVKKLYKNGKLFGIAKGKGINDISYKVCKERKMISTIKKEGGDYFIEFREKNDTEGFSVIIMYINERGDGDD